MQSNHMLNHLVMVLLKNLPRPWHGKVYHEDPYCNQISRLNPAKQGPVLKKGMTICVEPMVNIGTKARVVLHDNWTTVTVIKK